MAAKFTPIMASPTETSGSAGEVLRTCQLSTASGHRRCRIDQPTDRLIHTVATTMAENHTPITAKPGSHLAHVQHSLGQSNSNRGFVTTIRNTKGATLPHSQ
jgi:hypothetical protein